MRRPLVAGNWKMHGTRASVAELIKGLRQLALPDAFLDAGALPTLHERYGISAERMAASLKAWLT